MIGAEQSLGSCVLSGLFIIFGLLALAWATHRDTFAEWCRGFWQEITEDIL